MIQPKRSNPIVEILTALAVGTTILAVVLFVISATITLLWNFVMPIFGLPQIGYLHALAMFLLFRMFKFEHKPKQNLVLNASLVPVRKEPSDESNPRNKYPV